MECIYCYNRIDAEEHKPVLISSSRIYSNIISLCEKCNKILLKHEKEIRSLNIKGQQIEIKQFPLDSVWISKLKTPDHPVPKCSTHGKKLIGICKNHYKLICSKCISCRNCEIEQFNNGQTVEDSLDLLINHHRKTHRIRFPKDALSVDNTYALMETLTMKFQEMMRICEDGINSKSNKTKKEALKIATPILESTSDKLKSFNEFFDIVINENQKRNQMMMPFGMFLGPQSESSESDDDFRFPTRDLKPHVQDDRQEVNNCYEYLRLQEREVLKLFSKHFVYTESKMSQTLFISQNVYDEFPIVGIAIGACLSDKSLIIKSLEVSLPQRRPWKQYNQIFDKTGESIVVEVSLLEPVMLKKGQAVKISLEVEAGESFYMFLSPYSEKVKIFNDNNEVFNLSDLSAILYLY